MNWKQISKQCPKAWQLLSDRHLSIEQQNRLLSADYKSWHGVIFDACNLYAFFDGKGIIGSIIFDGGLFFGKISQRQSDGTYSSAIGEAYVSRSEAEDYLFPQEFSILESQLQTEEGI